MAYYEPYDYLADATPDYSYDLVLDPQNVLNFNGVKPHIGINEGDDLSEETIIHSNKTIFFPQLVFNMLSRTDWGIIFDLYHDPDKACGDANSFYWTPPTDYDGHTYVAKFRMREQGLNAFYRNVQFYGFGTITLKVIGRKPD